MGDGEAWFILEEFFEEDEEEDECEHRNLDRLNSNYFICKDCGKKIKSENGINK